jgi:hypothetical protein
MLGVTVDLSFINDELARHDPSEMELRGVSSRARTVSLAFAFHGGPKEDLEFIVQFEDCIAVHLPAVLRSPVRLNVLSAEEAEAVVPAVSFEALEFASYRLIALISPTGTRYGYYVAAAALQSRWQRLEGA